MKFIHIHFFMSLLPKPMDTSQCMHGTERDCVHMYKVRGHYKIKFRQNLVFCNEIKLWIWKLSMNALFLLYWVMTRNISLQSYEMHVWILIISKVVSIWKTHRLTPIHFWNNFVYLLYKLVEKISILKVLHIKIINKRMFIFTITLE